MIYRPMLRTPMSMVYGQQRRIQDLKKEGTQGVRGLPPLPPQTIFSIFRVKVKVQVFYSLISSLKTYHRTLHSTPWSLDLLIHVPFHLPGEHTARQPFRRIELIVHIAISALPGTHFHLSQVKHLRVKCLAQGHTILTMSQY